jgi:hypothetical protein
VRYIATFFSAFVTETNCVWWMHNYSFPCPCKTSPLPTVVTSLLRTKELPRIKQKEWSYKPAKWASAFNFGPIRLRVTNLSAKRITRPAFQLLSTSCCIYFLLGWVQFSTE